MAHSPRLRSAGGSVVGGATRGELHDRLIDTLLRKFPDECVGEPLAFLLPSPPSPCP